MHIALKKWSVSTVIKQISRMHIHLWAWEMSFMCALIKNLAGTVQAPTPNLLKMSHRKIGFETFWVESILLEIQASHLAKRILSDVWNLPKCRRRKSWTSAGRKISLWPMDQASRFYHNRVKTSLFPNFKVLHYWSQEMKTMMKLRSNRLWLHNLRSSHSWIKIWIKKKKIEIWSRNSPQANICRTLKARIYIVDTSSWVSSRTSSLLSKEHETPINFRVRIKYSCSPNLPRISIQSWIKPRNRFKANSPQSCSIQTRNRSWHILWQTCLKQLSTILPIQISFRNWTDQVMYTLMPRTQKPQRCNSTSIIKCMCRDIKAKTSMHPRISTSTLIQTWRRFETNVSRLKRERAELTARWRSRTMGAPASRIWASICSGVGMTRTWYLRRRRDMIKEGPVMTMSEEGYPAWAASLAKVWLLISWFLRKRWTWNSRGCQTRLRRNQNQSQYIDSTQKRWKDQGIILAQGSIPSRFKW